MSGSTEGGLTLTVYGNYFDDSAPYAAPKAYVGGKTFKLNRYTFREAALLFLLLLPISVAVNS